MKRLLPYVGVILITAVLTGLLVSFLINIKERKDEVKIKNVSVVDLTEETIDPAVWGRNFPREYDAYKKTVDVTHTKYGGSEGISKLETDPYLKTIFAGYAFSVDYKPRRGHYYSMIDQQETERVHKFKQVGNCMHCHTGGIKSIYEKVGDGDMMKGFEKLSTMPLKEAWQYASHPVACVDCHDPRTMNLRVTRPAFIEGIRKFKEKEGIKNYDPNAMATRQEMRTFVCAQCHVEYYCGSKEKVLYPWGNGLKVEEIEEFYKNYKFKDGESFFDFKHALTGAKVFKAQHPEFELYSQGIHAKSGVACADCHMPYVREGATKVTDHYVRSPLLNIQKSCLQCHHVSEKEMLERVESIQDKTQKLMMSAESAVVDLINVIVELKNKGVNESELEPLYDLQRKAQWRVDFINAENSMGFHAPQEAARILAESIDYARQGEVLAQKILLKMMQQDKDK